MPLKSSLFKPLLRVLPLCLAACSIDVSTPTVVSLESSSAGPLVQGVRLELLRAAPVEIEYWSEGTPRLRVRSDASTSHTLNLTRLRAATSYQFEVRGTAERGSFVTEALPEDLQEIRFVATGSPSVPLVLVHVTTQAGFRGYVIVDRSGSVVWYTRNTGFPFGMARRSNGNLVLMDGDQGLREITPAGEVVAQLAQDRVNREMHHDAIATRANSLLFLAFDTRPWNGVPLKGESIWEWWPETGRVEKRWSSWDFMTPERDRGLRFGGEWLHANSLSIGPRGNVVMSMHYLNQVISIAPGWDRIEWRLGGPNATHTLAEADLFSAQHTAAEIATNRVLLFDNGIERGGPSRALELELVGGAARRQWSWEPSPANYAFAVSSARRLANGNTLVGFGMREGSLGSFGGTEAYEVTENGQTLWHLRVEGPTVMFRAEPVQSVGLEEG